MNILRRMSVSSSAAQSFYFGKFRLIACLNYRAYQLAFHYQNSRFSKTSLRDIQAAQGDHLYSTLGRRVPQEMRLALLCVSRHNTAAAELDFRIEQVLRRLN